MFNLTKFMQEGAFGGFVITVEKADNGIICNISGNVNNQGATPPVFESKSKKLLYTGTPEEIKAKLESEVGIGKFIEV